MLMHRIVAGWLIVQMLLRHAFSLPAKLLSNRYTLTLYPVETFKKTQLNQMVSLSTCRAKVAALRAVILGAPASGKGTVSSRIIRSFDITHISSGDKLRQHIASGTELGKKVKQYIDTGRFVPDDVIIALINEEIESLNNRNWLLDGFPRTVVQAEKLQKVHPVSLVVNLEVPHDIILERASRRWIHVPSGRSYNIGFNNPKVPGKDDVTGDPLSQRPDDKPEVVKKRLDDYEKKTQPVIKFYHDIGILKTFKGSTTDSIWPHIKECISRYL